jgi:transposase-like protein
MDKWFVAIWSITNAKNGISSCELARAIGITQKSAWHLLHRVRHAMKTGSFEKFSGEIEADECYIGGKFENMHASRRREMATKKSGKAIVHGIIQRHKKTGKDDKRTSKAIASVIPNAKEKTIMPIIRSAVEPGSFIYTDEAGAYRCINNTSEFVHQAIDHAETYVRGRCHTNSMENFWSLLKRMVKGTYVSVDAPHLGRYVDEELFRFNERELTDGQRFATVLPGVIGKRLTYKSLTGAGTLEGLARNEETGRDDVRPN